MFKGKWHGLISQTGCHQTSNVNALKEHKALTKPVACSHPFSSTTGLLTDEALLPLLRLSDAGTKLVTSLQNGLLDPARGQSHCTDFW